MTGKALALCVILLGSLGAFIANLSSGATSIPLDAVFAAFFAFDAENYDHYVILYQRLPRALMAIHAGALMACGGVVLQGLTRNPLASPSTLGINSGAAFFVVAGAYVFDLGTEAQGLAAMAGAAFGFICVLSVARLAGGDKDPRGLSLILSGALVSMLLIGLANAFLLSDPARRSDFLGWVTGNINHVYFDRLVFFWPLGVLALAGLFFLARPLTLLTLGEEKAASVGVSVRRVPRLALLCVVIGSGSAVAICGPVGFVGLVVPHVVRPLVGVNMRFALPAAALFGACACLLADILARQAFAPYVLHTGILLDLIGGTVFAVIVKRFYLSPGGQTA
ncbi:iron ABC transporter permease [Roseibium sp. CAU 1637]|uniref:Iron ABC transporter permease n=1 Tax=Roseibium limicola TaxID=2816037 RepID=A0A939J5I8_9HYPH|nr:iron ABC transporter permease [Roseibium limicola]MBO0344107.1 iron ABC transporter permease [Roseibium limicola]